MGYRKIPPRQLAILFCLAVVRSHWQGAIPTLEEAAKELGVCRELASRLRRRFFEPFLSWLERMSRPGPQALEPDGHRERKRITMLEDLLGLARAVIASAGIAALAPQRREEVVIAIERLHSEHGVGYEEAAGQLGLCSRTLRRLRSEHRAGIPLEPKSRAPIHPHGKLPDELARAIEAYVSLRPAIPLAELHRLFVNNEEKLHVAYGHPDLSYGAFSRASGRKPDVPSAEPHPPERGRDHPENLPYRALALMDTTDLSAFGFDFKLIPFLEAHSRTIFAHEVCECDKAEAVARVFEQGSQNCGGVLSLRVDRGTPYLAELTIKTVEDQSSELRVARAHTPTDKALIERFNLRAKEALASLLGCLDLREGPGDLAWRKQLAKTLTGAVFAFYMRWCYPYIPQPHVDGRTPDERTRDTPPDSPDTIREILDERARHHQHARSVALRLREQYGFRWSATRFLAAVRGYRAEDLLEAERRFDRVLLQKCFTCDSKRNPPYFLAVLRNVAELRRPIRAQQDRERCWRKNCETNRQKVETEERQRQEHPEEAIAKALELAAIALQHTGRPGLNQARRWAEQALQTIARRGGSAYRLTTERLITQAPSEPVRLWLKKFVEQNRPPPSSVSDDLEL